LVHENGWYILTTLSVANFGIIVKIWGSFESTLAQRQKRIRDKSAPAEKDATAKQELADLRRDVRKLQRKLTKTKKALEQKKSNGKKRKK